MISRQQAKNPFRKVKKVCEKCGKIYKEAAKPLTIKKTSNIDEETKTCERIEEEFLPYCEKCFKADLKRYKKTQRMTEMLKAKFIDEEILKRYRDNAISNQELDSLWREFQKCQ